MVIKENPCNKCASYTANKVCECDELVNYMSDIQESQIDAVIALAKKEMDAATERFLENFM